MTESTDMTHSAQEEDNMGHTGTTYGREVFGSLLETLLMTLCLAFTNIQNPLKGLTDF